MTAFVLLSVAFVLYGALSRPVYGPELPEHMRPLAKLDSALAGLVGGAIGLVGVGAWLCWAVVMLCVFLAPLAAALLVLRALL